jgi:hypothetical protein
MKSNVMAKGIGFLAALSLASAAFAATPPPNRQRAASPEYANGDLSQNASVLLSELHDNAYTVRNLADQLHTYDRTPLLLVNYQPDAATLERMRNRIDQMDRTLYRLRGMAGNLPPEQRAEVNRITPAMVEFTDTTQTAILCRMRVEARPGVCQREAGSSDTGLSQPTSSGAAARNSRKRSSQTTS